MRLTGNKILITGGATGIGFGFAERFIQEGNTVLICGRRASALQEASVKAPSLITKQCDLQSENERIALYKWIAAEHPDLNVLINNAGVQNWMSLEDPEFYKKAKDEISINIESPLHMMMLFKELGSLQTIINVTSALAFSPLAKVPVYSATKAFLHSLTLSFRHLLGNTDIELIEIIPPALNTDLGGKGIHDSMPSIDLFIDAVFEQLKEEKKELTHGFSDKYSKIGQPELQIIFEQMNPIG